MNFFEIDYTQKATALLTEALKLKKYKALNLVLAIFTAVFMLPLIIVDILVAGAVYVLGFFFNLMSSPIDFIHSVLAKEGREVKHATQFIIYFISWPIVFFSYVFLSFAVVSLNLLYAMLSILTYACSLGGFKFHVAITNSEDISIPDAEGKKALIRPLIYIGVSALILLILPLIDTIVTCIDAGTAKYFFDFFKLYVLKKLGLSMLFSFVYSVIAYSIKFESKK